MLCKTPFIVSGLISYLSPVIVWRGIVFVSAYCWYWDVLLIRQERCQRRTYVLMSFKSFVAIYVGLFISTTAPWSAAQKISSFIGVLGGVAEYRLHKWTCRACLKDRLMVRTGGRYSSFLLIRVWVEYVVSWKLPWMESFRSVAYDGAWHERWIDLCWKMSAFDITGFRVSIRP